ncbi:hypothetical protein AVEN_209888-1 [Araneus ventricosus]|uniref:Uncharacterized protein n=1 Tax=Araneus ventricosus TaxID=182803 RepID=A0A4Y2QFU2_ARAVE|nr:hypothetical protein AVEN_209888-1 [Araneus ventricosus]
MRESLGEATPAGFLISRVVNSKAGESFRKASASESGIPTLISDCAVVGREGPQRLLSLYFVKLDAKSRVICSNRDVADAKDRSNFFSTCCPIRYFSVCPECYVNKLLFVIISGTPLKRTNNTLKKGHEHHGCFTFYLRSVFFGIFIE